MNTASLDQPQRPDGLDRTSGFLVADARGRVVGRVARSVARGSPQTNEALPVRFSLFGWRRRFVPADAIETIDEGTKVVGLRVDRTAIRAFF